MTLLLLILTLYADAQFYCWPCALNNGVFGKYTSGTSEPIKSYNWMMKYLNNVVGGAHNLGRGYRSVNKPQWGIVVNESWDASPNVMGLELNECGTFFGNYGANISQTGKMTPEEKELVNKGERLPTGDMHQCKCATQGRGHLINGSFNQQIKNFGAVADRWGEAYMKKVYAYESISNQFLSLMAPDEASAFNASSTFGLHNVYCTYHTSGPCLLKDVERVAQSWGKNFSKGYVPLMDNNLMLWTATLDPLLNAFLQDGIEFYPMRWRAPGMDNEVFSVLTSPGGKTLLEIAAPDAGQRSPELFHQMPHSRAIFESWNKPIDVLTLPLVPLRVSRAIGAHRFDETLAFYGVDKDGTAVKNSALGFQTSILADEVDESGARAVTLMLSSDATVHMQLWLRPEEEPHFGPGLPSTAEFEEAANTNQINRLPNKNSFCSDGVWTVSRYVEYVIATHKATMTDPPINASTATPPIGKAMDIFLDDHVSWDCTSPDCNVAKAAEYLYSNGLRITYVGSQQDGMPVAYAPYTYDPAGYGIQLHWFAQPSGFAPEGEPVDSCWNTKADGTCSHATTKSEAIVSV